MAKTPKRKPTSPARADQRKAPAPAAKPVRQPKPAAEMFNILLMLVRVEGPIESLGEHRFRSIPRTGEYIVKEDADGRAQAYRVMEIHHPDRPMPVAADAFVCHVGTEAYHLDGLRDRLRGTFR